MDKGSQGSHLPHGKRVKDEAESYGVLLDIIRRRRSTRLFEPRPVPRDVVLRALEAARWAPSGANIQPWEFLVVDNPETVDSISSILIREREFVVSADPRFPAYGRSTRQGVKCYILVLSDMRLRKAYPQTTDFVVDLTQYAALGWTTANLHLALTALGLACYFDTPEEPTEAELKRLLEIPEPFMIFTVTPVGYGRQVRTSSRRGLEEIVHWNGFNQSLERTDDEVQALVGDKKTVALAMSGRWEKAEQEARRRTRKE